MKRYLLVYFLIAFLFVLVSCENNYYPKPRGFFRIDLPEKNYMLFDSVPFPYSFYFPDYVIVKSHNLNNSEPFWIDLQFLPFDATLHISYKRVNNNLDVYLEDAHTFVNKHIPKANAINENVYINNDSRVYGLVYNIEGSEAASPLQFYLTDSTRHFLRGAFYFNFTPNNDSLAPVINYVKEDVTYLIETFNWK